MTHQDHVALIRRGIEAKGGEWVDFGSGEGAFTLALRDVAGSQVKIYSVDKNQAKLEIQKTQFDLLFPDSRIHFIAADFTQPLTLPPLDGILIANSLHFVINQLECLMQFKTYLKPGGTIIIVEYNADSGNTWVPYPISFSKLTSLAISAGCNPPRFLHGIPSHFLNEIYSAHLKL